METKSSELKSGQGDVCARGLMHLVNQVPGASVTFACCIIKTKSLDNTDIETFTYELY